MSDEWIIGTSAESGQEYIIHLQEPRFIAKYQDSEEDLAALGGRGLSVGTDGYDFFDIEWIGSATNPGLSDSQLLELFSEAGAAIERWTFSFEEEEDETE